MKSANSCFTHLNLQIPAETQSWINASNERFWEPPIRRYVEECLAGKTGVREKDFTMRWAAATVAKRPPHPDARRNIHDLRDTRDLNNLTDSACCTRPIRWPWSLNSRWPGLHRL